MSKRKGEGQVWVGGMKEGGDEGKGTGEEGEERDAGHEGESVQETRAVILTVMVRCRRWRGSNVVDFDDVMDVAVEDHEGSEEVETIRG